LNSVAFTEVGVEVEVEVEVGVAVAVEVAVEVAVDVALPPRADAPRRRAFVALWR
jgi:hypothetical protein